VISLLACSIAWSHAPAAADPAVAAASPDGAHFATLTTWVDEAPGFPNARLELFDLRTRSRMAVWQVRLVGPASLGGVRAASAEVRARAADALRAVRIELDASKPGAACAETRCGDLEVDVLSTRTPDKAEQCYGRVGPDLLSITVNSREWLSETFPADGCPSAWRAHSAWIHGDSVVLLLSSGPLLGLPDRLPPLMDAQFS
jgi:hypothetical protein